MSVNQNEIDALLNSNDQSIKDESGNANSIDEIVAQTIADTSDATPPPAITKSAEPLSAQQLNTDASESSTSDSLSQMRAAQKVLFEVFSSIPDKKDRTRLLNWANDAFIKSKFF